MKKNKSRLNLVANLLSLIEQLKLSIIIALLCGLIGDACGIAFLGFAAACIAKIIDPEFTSIWLETYVIMMVVSALVCGLSRFYELYDNHYVGFRIVAKIRSNIFATLRRLAPAKLDNKKKGDLISMITTDVESLETFYAKGIAPVCVAVIIDIVVVVFVGITAGGVMAFLTLFAYVAVGALVPFMEHKLVEEASMNYTWDASEATSYFLDSIKGVTDIVINNRQSARSLGLDARTNLMDNNSYAIKEKSIAIRALTDLIVSIFILCACLVGVVYVDVELLSLSNMIVAIVLMFAGFAPVLTLANLPQDMSKALAAGDRITNLLREEPLVEEKFSGVAFEFEELDVEDVVFSYDPRALEKVRDDNQSFWVNSKEAAEAAYAKQDDSIKNAILKNANLHVDKGDIVGIVGESGCGKSSLLKLMLRFYDPSEGRVSYNGFNVKNIDAYQLHKNVVMVGQETYLFNDTIKNNLLIAKEDATDMEIAEACRMASVDEFINKLDMGYDTPVGLLGDSISAGEKQRIGLARAFLSGAPLILLDEVTSNVDAINEGMILKSLKDMAGERTIILVSHRESTMSICNQVYRMRDGKLRKLKR